MKKIVTVLVLMVFAFSLVACNMPSQEDNDDHPNGSPLPNDDITLSVTASVEDAPITILDGGPYEAGDTVTIIAEAIEGKRFDHFRDVDLDVMLTDQSTLAIALNRSRTIKAVYVNLDEYGVSVEANIDGAPISVDRDGPYALGTEIIVSAEDDGERLFHQWIDGLTMEPLSDARTYKHTVEGTRRIVAMYRVIDGLEIFYQTGFEDTTKQAYASGTLTTEGKDWHFEDTLIGSLDNDQKIGNRSARLRDGYIQTLFSIESLQTISFHYGAYGNDSSHDIQLKISDDGEDFVVLETFRAQGDFEQASVTLAYDTLPFNPSDALYVKIVSETNNRANIDEIQFETPRYSVFELPEMRDAGAILFPNESERIDLTLRDDFVQVFSLGDSWEGDACEANDETFGEVDCYVYGTVDTTSIGRYTITYYALDEDGLYASKQVEKYVLRDATLLDKALDDYDGYYQEAFGLFGENLHDALHAIINDGVTLPSYSEIIGIMQESDRDPDNSDNVMLIYTQLSVPAVWDQGTTWNREHVWPVRRMPVDRPGASTRNMGSDAHNLTPANPAENNSRGFKYFAETTTTTSYAPPAVVRGDVARMMFYMITMYESLSLASNPNADNFEMGELETLLLWHFEHQVREFETVRNDIIYHYQNNRNPFIDYPHFVELLYWDHPEILDWFD